GGKEDVARAAREQEELRQYSPEPQGFDGQRAHSPTISASFANLPGKKNRDRPRLLLPVTPEGICEYENCIPATHCCASIAPDPRVRFDLAKPACTGHARPGPEEALPTLQQPRTVPSRRRGNAALPVPHQSAREKGASDPTDRYVDWHELRVRNPEWRCTPGRAARPS